jgi:hypothetical protein
MLEEDIGNLIVALERNTEVLQKLHDLKVGDVPTIGELEQEMYDKQEVGEEKPPIKAAKKKASKKSAKKTKPAEETPVVMDAAAVQTHLRGIASQLTDTSKLFALIQKHGGQQFSDLDSSVYEALIADAEQLVVDGV